jgi:putative lipoprotein
MTRPLRLAHPLLVGLLVAGVQCRPAATVKGTATYRERMALPPGAVLETTLVDVSRADPAAEVIGQARVEAPGNPPIRFEIPYDRFRINPRHGYVVRARIMVAGKPMFTTDRDYPVLTGGKGDQLELLLQRR